MIQPFFSGVNKLSQLLNPISFIDLSSIHKFRYNFSLKKIVKQELKIPSMKLGSNRIKFSLHGCNRRFLRQFFLKFSDHLICPKSGSGFTIISISKREPLCVSFELSSDQRRLEASQCMSICRRSKQFSVLLLWSEARSCFRSISIPSFKVSHRIHSIITIMESKFESLPIAQVEALLLAHESRLNKFKQSLSESPSIN